MKPVRRGLLILFTSAMVGCASSTWARADDDSNNYVKQLLDVVGPRTMGRLAEQDIRALAKAPGDDGQSVQRALDLAAPRYEYSSTFACQDTAPGSNPDALCTNALIACTNPADGPGPLTGLWRRTLVQA